LGYQKKQKTQKRFYIPLRRHRQPYRSRLHHRQRQPNIQLLTVVIQMQMANSQPLALATAA